MAETEIAGLAPLIQSDIVGRVRQHARVGGPWVSPA